MTAHEAIELPSDTRATSAGIADDMQMLRAAVELTRDISAARAAIYWPDMLLSALLGYAGLAGAIVLANPWLALASGVFGSLALYRALLFIHELTHIHRTALPGFRFGWNALVGIPMLIPSLMYENVHTLHHARTRYGTAEDPEYLPLGLMKPWSLPVFILSALLLPVGLLIRSALLVPLGAIIPPLRNLVWERASSLSINPAFRRRPRRGRVPYSGGLAGAGRVALGAVPRRDRRAVGLAPARDRPRGGLAHRRAQPGPHVGGAPVGSTRASR